MNFNQYVKKSLNEEENSSDENEVLIKRFAEKLDEKANEAFEKMMEFVKEVGSKALAEGDFKVASKVLRYVVHPEHSELRNKKVIMGSQNFEETIILKLNNDDDLFGRYRGPIKLSDPSSEQIELAYEKVSDDLDYRINKFYENIKKELRWVLRNI